MYDIYIYIHTHIHTSTVLRPTQLTPSSVKLSEGCEQIEAFSVECYVHGASARCYPDLSDFGLCLKIKLLR